MAENNEVRNHNVGASDYSKHKFQSWDFWIKFRLNPFDADLVKRILRKKSTDGRLLDYQKIQHILSERVRQLTTSGDVFQPVYNKWCSYTEFKNMLSDYDISENDKLMLKSLLLSTSDSRLADYEYCLEIVAHCI